MGKARVAFFNYLDSVYKDFLKAAKVRYETGQVSKVEKVSAEGKYESIRVRVQNARKDLKRYNQNLKNELNVDKAVSIARDSIIAYEKPGQLDTSQLRNNPMMEFYRQSIRAKEMQHKVEQNKLLPSFTVEWGYQDFGFNSGQTFRLGVGVPLWSRPQQGRIQSAKIQISKERQQYRNVYRQLQQQFQEAYQNYQKHLSEYQYYQDKGLSVSRKLIKSANKSFKAGAIDYVEYVQFVDTRPLRSSSITWRPWITGISR